MNRLNLDALESMARLEGGTEKGMFNFGGTYDKTYLASKMLNNALLTKSALARLVEQKDCERAKHIAHFAISQLIDFAMNYHHWTVVDNEVAIAARNRSVDGGNIASGARILKNLPRNAKIIKRFLELQKEQEGKKKRISNSALINSLGEEFELGPTQVRAIIKDGLKNGAKMPGNPPAK
jgi:hypothetical protein